MLKEIDDTTKQKPKDKKVLNPVLIENKDLNISNLEEIKKSLSVNNATMFKEEKESDLSDNFFRAVIEEMLSDKNISLKTEYVNLNENFSGAKLEFLAKYAGMPQLHDFINILEIKRVSFGRKSRVELIKAFEKRDEEIQAQERIKDFKTMLGV